MITRILYFIAVLGAILGIIVLLTVVASGGQPSPTSIVLAIAYAVVPYCLASAWQEISRS